MDIERLDKNEKDIKDIISLVDLTSLNSLSSVDKMCETILSSSIVPASVCVYPKHTKYVRTFFQKHNLPIKLTTVINFPNGILNYSNIINELNSVFFVDELDVVFDYLSWNIGNYERSILPIKTTIDWVSKQLHKPLVKVIIETSELKDDDVSRVTSFILSKFTNQISFIKTSTGKSLKGGATIQAVKDIITSIKSIPNCKCGIKISGGINSFLDAAIYIDFLKFNGWEINPKTTRIGSSKIINEII